MRGMVRASEIYHRKDVGESDDDEDLYASGRFIKKVKKKVNNMIRCVFSSTR